MTITNHPRRQGREAVLQALYATEITGEDRTKVLKDIFKRRPYDDKMKNFITTLFDSAIDHKDWCEGQIKSRLNNWEFGRVALLDRLLLVVAICEIHFIDAPLAKVELPVVSEEC